MAGPEKLFENKLKKFLEGENIWFVKFFANRMTKEGIPDILACVNGHFVGIEVKAQNGKPSDLQLYHCNKIRESGGVAYVVYPSGFERFKEIIKELNCNDNIQIDHQIILK